MNIGKVLLIFFEGNEEKVIDSIISVLGVGIEKFAFLLLYFLLILFLPHLSCSLVHL